MEEAQVKRLICVTGFGAGDSRGHGGLLYNVPRPHTPRMRRLARIGDWRIEALALRGANRTRDVARAAAAAGTVRPRASEGRARAPRRGSRGDPNPRPSHLGGGGSLYLTPIGLGARGGFVF